MALGPLGSRAFWTGGEEAEHVWFLWLLVSSCGSAMGSRSSHVALIPDVDQIRRETGCECEVVVVMVVCAAQEYVGGHRKRFSVV